MNFGRSSGWGGDFTDSSGGEGWVARIHPPRTRTWIKVLISLNHCSPSSAFHQTVRYLWPLPFLPPSFFPRSPRSYHRPTLANRQKSICTYPMILKTRGLFFFSFFPFFFSSSPLNLYNHNTASRNRGDLNFDGTTMSLTSPPKLLLNLIQYYSFKLDQKISNFKTRHSNFIKFSVSCRKLTFDDTNFKIPILELLKIPSS